MYSQLFLVKKKTRALPKNSALMENQAINHKDMVKGWMKKY